MAVWVFHNSYLGDKKEGNGEGGWGVGGGGAATGLK